MNRELKPGDLVFCINNGASDYLIADSVYIVCRFIGPDNIEVVGSSVAWTTDRFIYANLTDLEKELL